jgi:hypothetical protein
MAPPRLLTRETLGKLVPILCWRSSCQLRVILLLLLQPTMPSNMPHQAPCKRDDEANAGRGVPQACRPHRAGGVRSGRQRSGIVGKLRGVSRLEKKSLLTSSPMPVTLRFPSAGTPAYAGLLHGTMGACPYRLRWSGLPLAAGPYAEPVPHRLGVLRCPAVALLQPLPPIGVLLVELALQLLYLRLGSVVQHGGPGRIGSFIHSRPPIAGCIASGSA